MLDTNACIAIINRSSAAVVDRLLEEHAEDVVTSVVSAAELRFGAERSARRVEARARLDLFLASVRSVPLDIPVVEAYGRIRADLARRGKPIGPLDTLVAAHATSLDLVLVTHNTREFRRVHGLRIDDWER